MEHLLYVGCDWQIRKAHFLHFFRTPLFFLLGCSYYNGEWWKIQGRILIMLYAFCGGFGSSVCIKLGWGKGWYLSRCFFGGIFIKCNLEFFFWWGPRMFIVCTCVKRKNGEEMKGMNEMRHAIKNEVDWNEWSCGKKRSSYKKIFLMETCTHFF